MERRVPALYLELLRNEPAIARLPEAEVILLSNLLQLLLEGQQRMNLTAITEPEAVARLHFADSLAALDAEPAIANAASAADIGTGAGFPLLPLAIRTTKCHWTGFESVGKKARFVEETAATLGLTNVSCAPMRAEDAARGPHRASFDVVTARAVGPVVSLCETGLPLVRLNGMLLLYKTETAVEELSVLTSTISMLGGTILPPYLYQLAGDNQQRVILRIEKSGETPDQYPRPAGKPFQKPLQ